MRGVDIREAGSRNIGATNAFRVLGARWGALVFLLDVAKGWVAALGPRLLTGSGPGTLAPSLLAPTLAAGLAAILGHVFTPWLRFRGGRGVATSLGVFLGIMPVPTLIALGTWVALLLLSKRVSVGSIGAALAYPVLVWLLPPRGIPRAPVAWVALVVAALVIVRHAANIRRLLSGTEPPILGRGSKPAATSPNPAETRR
jgi:glycerol-3-phosphate acyltransferase PlsY